MPFTIPNEADAAHAAQAEPDSVDFAILGFASGGIGVVSGCAVTDGASGMNVDVAAGRIRSAGTESAVAATTVTPGNGHATNPRWDLVVASSTGVVSVVAGTAAANPVLPAVPAGSATLAAVYVPATVTTLSSGNLVDKRAMVAIDRTFGDFGFPRTRNVRRGHYARFGGVDEAGGAPSNNTEYTIFDSDDASYGGVNGSTEPGWISRLSLFISGSTAEWARLFRLRIYYGDDTAPTIDGPIAPLMSIPSGNYAGFRLPDFAGHANDAPASGSQYHLMLPIPWTSKIKVTIVTPNTGATSTPGLWTGVDFFRGEVDAFSAGSGQRKLRAQWYNESANTNVSPNVTGDDVLSVQAENPAHVGPGCFLSAAINNSVTSITVDKATNLTRAFQVNTTDPRTGTTITNITTAPAPNLYAYIENECIRITAISGNTLTVVRGENDPITGAATTAASHSQWDFVTRVQGPGRVHMWLFNAWGQTGLGWCEGPVWIGTDRDKSYNAAKLQGGGVEDMFGNGFYGGQEFTGSAWLTPDLGCWLNAGGTIRGFYRSFGSSDPMWFDLGFQAGSFSQTGPVDPGFPGAAPGWTYYTQGLWWYTEN